MLLVLEADEVLQKLLGVAVKVLGQDVVAITEIKVFFNCSKYFKTGQ